MSSYVELPITTDLQTLQDEAVAFVQSKVPGYTLDPAHPMTWLLEACARMVSVSLWQASLMPSANLRVLGETVYGMSSGNGSNAIAATTWTASDALGHTIVAGTQLLIDDIPFITDATVVIAPGASTTSVGGVLVTAEDVGVAGNGLGVSADPVDSLSWVSGITVVGTSSGGADSESDEDFQDRLTSLLRMQSPRAITALDFEVNAVYTSNGPRPGIARAAVIDNYDPTTNLLTANQASVETDTTGWAAGTSCSIARTTSQSSDGAASLQVTRNSTTGTSYAETGQVVIIAGETYYVSAEVRAATTVRVAQVQLNWYDNVGAFISTSTPTVTPTDSAAAWTSASITAQAPSNAYKVVVVVLWSSAVATEVHYVDKVQLKLSTVATTWTAGGSSPLNAQGHITVAPIDDAGANVAPVLRTAMEADLNIKRIANLLVHVINPVRTPITVAYSVVAYSGFDKTALQTSIDAALTEYFSPAQWGTPPYLSENLLPFSTANKWINSDIVYYLQVARIIENVEGVRSITTLTTNAGTANITMPGPAPLPLLQAIVTHTVS